MEYLADQLEAGGVAINAVTPMRPGAIIAACWNNSIYAGDAKTGKVRWRFKAAVPASKGVDWIGYSGFHLTPVLDGDRLDTTMVDPE